MATGTAREVACLGTRGDGKTWGALWAMVLHALEHQKAGHPLPVPWIGVTDTFRSHELKTVRTLNAPAWQGRWKLSKQDHVAIFTVEGLELVRLDLFGIEDAGALDRVRMETAGVWFEEPVPAGAEASGVSEDAWNTAITSQRVKTHAHVAMLTSNYPSREHWVWKRFFVDVQPGRVGIRIPPGERASAEDRAEWDRALSGNPAQKARLLDGEPAEIPLGKPVAQGWRSAHHVANRVYEPVEWAPLWVGWDAGHMPSTVIGQRVDGRVRVYAALTTQGGGTRQHIEALVRPWLEAHAPWTLARRDDPTLYHAHDPSMNTGDQSDTDASPIRVIRAELGGVLRAGAVTWEGRREPMLALFNLAVNGEWALQVNPGPDTELLRRAWESKWHYPTTITGEVRSIQPAKPNAPWADIGDAGCYFIGGVAPHRPVYKPGPPQFATPTRNPWDLPGPSDPRRQAVASVSSGRW